MKKIILATLLTTIASTSIADTVTSSYRSSTGDECRISADDGSWKSTLAVDDSSADTTLKLSISGNIGHLFGMKKKDIVSTSGFNCEEMIAIDLERAKLNVKKTEIEVRALENQMKLQEMQMQTQIAELQLKLKKLEQLDAADASVADDDW